MSTDSKSSQPFQQFSKTIQAALESGEFIKLTLSKPAKSDLEYRNIYVHRIRLKSGPALSFVYRRSDKDITRNYSTPEGIAEIESYIGSRFLNADLFTKANDIHLKVSRKGRARSVSGPPTLVGKLAPEGEERRHDREKHRFIRTEGNLYLRRFGITDDADRVKPSRQDKFKQINRYVEIIAHILQKHPLTSPVSVYDMGSGKGYLTFALYDYLSNQVQLSVEMTGVEVRTDLVGTCNSVATQAGFSGLHFIEGHISEISIESADMLIALHACDTATDDAILQGIRCNAGIILVAPCCHTQIRQAMEIETDMAPIQRYGILAERQAAIVTDALRALMLRLHGYTVNVFEFIDIGHTAKNVMISALRSDLHSDDATTGGPAPSDRKQIVAEIEAIKAHFGISHYYLEQRLE
jgi:hypothetical protein